MRASSVPTTGAKAGRMTGAFGGDTEATFANRDGVGGGTVVGGGSGAVVVVGAGASRSASTGIDRGPTTATVYANELAKNGRDDRIRTCDPLTPSQVRYQAAPHPDDRILPCCDVNLPICAICNLQSANTG